MKARDRGSHRRRPPRRLENPPWRRTGRRVRDRGFPFQPMPLRPRANQESHRVGWRRTREPHSDRRSNGARRRPVHPLARGSRSTRQPKKTRSDPAEVGCLIPRPTAFVGVPPTRAVEIPEDSDVNGAPIGTQSIRRGKKSTWRVTRGGDVRDRIGVEATDGEMYRKHAEELTRFATGLVGPSHAADVVSEAVLRCMDSARWAQATEKRAYLYRCVYNEAARFHRSSNRRRLREERTAQRESVEPPEVRPEVLSAVARLSTRQRAVICLTYWDDLSPAAIATLLGISDGSVRRHLARGRSRLKEILDVND
jgi:RNA polymerase sigma-70 factor (ECF subfamily)